MTPHDHEFALAGVPGFHGLLRTALVGTDGPGGVVLDVYCQCEPEHPVAKVAAHWRKRKGRDTFTFIELGRGAIALTPALDLRSDHGHFVTEPVWRTSPDGWTQIGTIDKAKIKALKTSLTPPTGKAASTSARKEADAKCGCGHPLGNHDPCSICLCPSFHRPGRKVERFKRRT